MAKKKAAPTTELIELTIGEKRLGMQSSTRCYFFYVSPTGAETSFKDCPFSHIAWMKGGRQEDDGTRVSEMGLNITQPIIVKMASNLTQFGKPMNWKHLYLTTDPNAEKIEVRGLGPSDDERFGKFIGRATIHEELSHMTEKEVQKHFKLRILAGPRVDRPDNVRSLIINND